MAPIHIRAATGQDAPNIHRLLDRAGLPTADLISSQPHFIVACDSAKVVAAGALQRFGDSALLRSVVVAEDVRGMGLGTSIVQELEQIACASRITQLILLTQTAKRFFEFQGYRVIERSEVPGDVQQSEEFRSLCPASATCMAKSLNERS